MSIIRAEVSGYRHIGYYDSEFVIKGILHIDTRQYNFLHYDGAFGFSRLEIKTSKVKTLYDEVDGFQMENGRDTPEGDLLYTNRTEAIKLIQEAASTYLATNQNAWVEYFNLATRSAVPLGSWTTHLSSKFSGKMLDAICEVNRMVLVRQIPFYLTPPRVSYF